MIAAEIERQCMTAIRSRINWRGTANMASTELGVSASHLLGILNGNARLGPRAAARILAAVRAEELALAERIEAELAGPALGETEE